MNKPTHRPFAGMFFAVSLVLPILWVSPSLARSSASITQAPADASRASVIEKLATGEMANFTTAQPPKKIPATEIKTLDGSAFTLDQFQGRVLVVNFWATWCAPCRRELPSLDRLQQHVGSEDLAVLAVSIDRRGADKVLPFLEEMPLPNLSVYLDQKNKLGRAFGTFGLPTTVLVDRNGYEVGRLVGPAEWDSDQAVALVRRVIEN